MKFFIDTANIDEIKQAIALGMCDGVTTNPSLVAKEGKSYFDMAKEICALVDGPVSLETVAQTANSMVSEGKKLAELGTNVVVKLPMCEEALIATRQLADENIAVNMTLCFSAMQGLLAAKAGAAYISPFVGRLDDISQDGMALIDELVSIYDNYAYETQILVASIRHPKHLLDAALMGADVATIPFSVLKQLVKHPLTDLGIEKFNADSKKVEGHI